MKLTKIIKTYDRNCISGLSEPKDLKFSLQNILYLNIKSYGSPQWIEFVPLITKDEFDYRFMFQKPQNAHMNKMGFKAENLMDGLRMAFHLA